MFRRLKDLRPRLERWWDAVRRADRDAVIFAGAYLLLLPFYLAPLLVTRLLPGLDLPFHLVMADMLSKAGDPGSPYAPYYQATPHLAPYAAYYFVLVGLSKLMSLATAHKVIIAAYVAGTPLAAGALLGAAGRSRVPALLAFPLTYNLTLHYGFVSFATSLPVLLLVLAELTRFLTDPRPRVWRWLTVAGAAGLLFLCHLQNFLYGVCAALAFLVFSAVPWRRRLLGLAALVPSAAMLAFWQVSARFADDPSEERRSLAFAWSQVKFSRVADLGGAPWRKDIEMRIFDLPDIFLRGFNDHVDVRAARTLLVLILLYFCLGVAGRFIGNGNGNGTAGRTPRMRVAGWVAFAGALFAYLALPHHLPVFELTTFFPRFAALAVLLMLLVIPAGLRRLGGGLRWLVPVPAVLFCALYGRELTRHYRMYGEEVAGFAALLDRAPRGGKALGLIFDRASKVMRIESALLGMASFYPAARPAPGSMTMLSYCGMRHIPCRPRQPPPREPLPGPGPWSPGRLDPDAALRFYDVFFVRAPPSAAALFGHRQSSVHLAARQGDWYLFLRKPGGHLPPKVDVWTLPFMFPLATPPPPATWRGVSSPRTSAR